MITPRTEGDLVEWKAPTHPLRRGVVIRRGTEQDSERVDRLMHRTPGTSWATFGALLSVRCSESGCQCQPGSAVPGWLHGVNECQVSSPADDVAVALW